MSLVSSIAKNIKNMLVGDEIKSSTKLEKLMDELISEIGKIEASLTTVKDPQIDAVEKAKKIFDEIGKIRGRPLNYPFVGTGAGFGPYVEVEDGSVKLDLINGIGVNIFGHGHPQIRKAALRGALSDVIMQGNLEPNREYVEISKKLSTLAGKKSRLKHVWLSTCGTIANENAIKIARQKRTPARIVIAMANAFAGRSTMMAEVTDNPAYKQGLPEYNEVIRLPYYDSKDSQSIDKAVKIFQEYVVKHGKNICAFSFEPMLGEGGYKVAPREFWLPLLEICRKEKIPVWADEVQTFMRTGELFAFETLGIGEYVDICTIAKTLQTGATLYTEEMNPQPGLIAGTFSGGSTSLAVGLESLKILTEEGYLGPQGKIAKIHKEFIQMLNQLNQTTCKDMLRDAGGLGLMVAVTPLDGSKDAVNKLLNILYKNGLIAFSCGRDPYRLRFLIPAIVESRDIELAGKILEKSILEFKQT